MNGAYDVRLVALSVLISALSATTALDLANSVTASKGRARSAWLLGGALAMGTGLWGMHLVGMLAFSLPGSPIAYDLSTLTLSVSLSIVASAVVLYVVSHDRINVVAFAAAVISMVAAIAGVHYMGMAAMRMPAGIEWRIPVVAISIGIALATSWLAVWLSVEYRMDRRKTGASERLVGGSLVGGAIALMHYIALAAVRLTPSATRMGMEESDVLATPGLGFAVAGATVLILGIAFAGSVVGRELARRKDLAQENAQLYVEAKRELARRAEAETAHKESEERFRLLVNSVRDYAIFMLDPEGRVVSWNEGAERINGYSRQEIIGRHFSTFYSDDDRQKEHPEAELRIAASEGSYQEEGWRFRKGGDRFWASVLITAIRDEEGELVGFAKVTRDLTERKRAEDDREHLLQQERAIRLELQQANQVKSDFLAAMSHELRTPLNHIIGYADLLLTGTPVALPEPLCRSVERIAASARHLLNLIEEIFTFSRLDRGEEEVQPVPVSIPRVIIEAADRAAPLAREKGLQLRVNLPEGACEMTTDPRVLSQIVTHLLKNAVTFTAEGEVELSAMCRPEEVQIQVRDTGIGIAAEHQDSIFEPFFQVDGGTTRTADGTGMGLAVARRYAKALGGDITVRSSRGEGSTFTLQVPRVLPERRQEHGTSELPKANM